MMTQPAELSHNLPDIGGPLLNWEKNENEKNENEKTSYCVETPYGFQLDLDFMKYVDDIQSGQTLKKASVNRKPRVPRRSTSSLRSLSSQPGTWVSTESLDFCDDGMSDSVFFTGVRTETNSLHVKESLGMHKSNPISPTPIFKLLPPPPAKSLLKNSRVEKTLAETRKRLEQEQQNLYYNELQGRQCQSSNLSKLSVASRSSPNLTQASLAVHNNTTIERCANQNVSGSLKISPANSGRSTPGTNISSTHLQYIREQMAASLKQLKDLEEQVKVIPLLQMRISTLNKEKKQLMVELEKKKINPSKEPSVNHTNLHESDPRQNIDSLAVQEINLESEGPKTSKIAQLKRLTEKLSDTDRNICVKKMAAEKTYDLHPSINKDSLKSIAVGEDISMTDAVFYYKSQNTLKEVETQTTTKTNDVGVWVMESFLGLTCEADKEIQLLQHTIEHQKAVISMLENHVKAASDELDELRLAVFSRPFVGYQDKEMEQQETATTSHETCVPMLRKSLEEYPAASCSSKIHSSGITCVTKSKTVPPKLEHENKSSQGNPEEQSAFCNNTLQTVSWPSSDNKEEVYNIMNACCETGGTSMIYEDKIVLDLSAEMNDAQFMVNLTTRKVSEDSEVESNDVAEEIKNLKTLGVVVTSCA